MLIKKNSFKFKQKSKKYVKNNLNIKKIVFNNSSYRLKIPENFENVSKGLLKYNNYLNFYFFKKINIKNTVFVNTNSNINNNGYFLGIFQNLKQKKNIVSAENVCKGKSISLPASSFMALASSNLFFEKNKFYIKNKKIKNSLDFINLFSSSKFNSFVNLSEYSWYSL